MRNKLPKTLHFLVIKLELPIMSKYYRSITTAHGVRKDICHTDIQPKTWKHVVLRKTQTIQNFT